MDLNDPKRRLQVLNNSNPSIRTIAAPKPVQPTISVAKPVQPQLTVPQPKVASGPAPVPENQWKAIKLDEGTNKTIFGKNAAWLLPKSLEKTYGVTTQDATGTAEAYLKYFDTRDEQFRRSFVNKLQADSQNDPVAAKTLKLLQDSGRFKGNVNDFMEGANDKLYGGIGRGILRGVDFVLPGKNTLGLERLADQQDPTKRGDAQYTTAGKTGNVVGNVEKGIFDVATLLAGSGAVEQGVSKLPAAVSFLEKLQAGGRASQLTAKVLSMLPGSLAGSGISALQTAGKGDKQNLGKDIAVGTALDMLLPVVGKGVGKGINWLRGGREGAIERLISKLAKSNDEGSIRKQLASVFGEESQLTDNLAAFISQESDPATIRATLEGINASGIQMFNPASPSQSWLNDNMPGMRTPGTTDPVPEAIDAAKKFDNPQDFKNYVDSLDGEGKARVEAALNGASPEDFHAKVNPPKQVEAGGTKMLPEVTDSLKNMPNNVGDGFVMADKGTRGLKSLTDELNKIDQEISDIQMGRKASSREEIAQLNARREEIIKKAQEPFNYDAVDGKTTPATTQADEVANKVDEAAQVQSGTTAPEGAGSTIEGQPANNTELGTNTAQASENASQGMSQKAEDILPADADEPTRKAVQDVLDSLNRAESNYNTAAKVRSGEKGSRIGQASQAYDAVGGGEAGVRAKLSKLKGSYSKSKFEPLSVSDETQKTILDDIEKSDLLDFEKLNTQQALRKMWGATEDKPTPSDIRRIRDYFNSKEAGIGDTIAEGVEKGTKEDMNILEQIAGAPRTAMTVGDASAPRQLAVSFARHPIVTTKAYIKSFGEMFSGKKFAESTQKMLEMTDSNGKKYSDFMDSAMNLHFSNAAEGAAEEAMSSTQLLEKIPIAGSVVRSSNRGMSSATSWTRFNIAKKFIDDAGGVEGAEKLFSKEELADLGEVINTMTGRGGKKGGFTDRHASILSKTLFSGKLWASRMNMLNPYWYYRLSGPARKEAISGAASFAATAGATLGLISQIPGVEVSNDPTSADFAKIKIGNTRYDILGGFQQNIRVAAQILTGKRTNSTTGEQKDVTAASVVGGLIEGKANPLLGMAYKLANTLDDPNESNPLMRKDEWGNSINAGSELGSLAVPLGVSGTIETVKDTGSVAKGIAMNVPAVFGAGVQTYGTIPSKDQGKDSNGKLTFKGKITPDMVLDDAGKPILDDKGKPVKITIPKDATDLEIKALKDDKRKAALSEQYRTNLSSEDQALMKLNKDQLQQYVDNGNISQEKLDQIEQYQQDIENFGGVKVPKGAKSKLAQDFFKSYNSKTKRSQEKYLQSEPDETAKTITTLLNKERAEGLTEFKPSNELAKLYADYENDINSNQYSEVDLRNKAKEFQTKAYKLNYSTDQRDIYAEGGSSDLRTLIENKDISQKDLDEAIKMDNELYNSGLSGSLKFSKKFRRDYGYDVPEKYAASGSGGGGGDGDSTQRAYLSALMPSFSTGSKKVPTFSERSRTKGISFKDVNLPTAKSKPKISIKL